LVQTLHYRLQLKTEELFNCQQGQEICIFYKILTLALGLPASDAMGSRALALGQSGQGLMLITHFPFSSKVKIVWSYGAIPHHPLMPLWYNA